MNRKQRRALKKEIGPDFSETISLMLSLPEECSKCSKKFDKKDKEMALTWFVEVYSKEKKVILTCPECYEEKTTTIS